jgi:predicted transcriptional regulator
MSTTELKSNLHTLIENTNDSSVLNLIYSILSKLKKNTHETIVLTAAEKKAIDEGLLSIKTGKIRSHAKVMADMKKKFPSLIK